MNKFGIINNVTRLYEILARALAYLPTSKNLLNKYKKNSNGEDRTQKEIHDIEQFYSSIYPTS